jgi:protein TonB
MFNGTGVLLGLGGLCLLVGFTIVLLRRKLTTDAAPDGKRGKDAVFSLSAPLHRLSLCLAIAGSLVAINWTQFSGKAEAGIYVVEPDLEIDVISLPTLHEPPPPPPIIEAVTEPEEFDTQDIEVDEAVVATFAPPVPTALFYRLKAPPATPPPVPPLPPPPPDDIEDIRPFAERMPVFGTECFDLPDAERKLCSGRALLTFVQSRVRYPALAREINIEGMVVIAFTVEKDGTISDVVSVREVAGGCTGEALKAVNAITKEAARFQPGMQAGRPVRVRYNLPIRFKLE